MAVIDAGVGNAEAGAQQTRSSGARGKPSPTVGPI